MQPCTCVSLKLDSSLLFIFSLNCWLWLSSSEIRESARGVAVADTGAVSAKVTFCDRLTGGCSRTGILASAVVGRLLDFNVTFCFLLTMLSTFLLFCSTSCMVSSLMFILRFATVSLVMRLTTG